MFSTTDTIVAIATPPGRGGIGVVRISGARAEVIARELTDRGEPFVARHATLSTIRSSDGLVSDTAVVTFFPSPASYTGEHVAEISAHGSPVVLKAIVQSAMGAGARLAEPGEFTLRAFLNGRVDLTQAEAVADLIDAATPLQARAAFDQLSGTLTTAIGEIDAALFDLVARLEASVDFPEEGYHFVDPGALANAIDEILARVDRLLVSARRGRLLRDGLQIAIVGAPNAGKSSLFNALIGAERAIVNAVPGTTRDLVTETMDLEGLKVTLVDTAGLRETTDPVEAEGVARSRRAIDVADLILHVHDLTLLPHHYGDKLLSQIPDNKRLIVGSKADLGEVMAADGVIAVSVVTGAGLDALRHRIVSALDAQTSLADVPAISNVRHIALVDRAATALRRARLAADQDGNTLSEEFVLADLQDARAALEEVTGRRTSGDLLAHIFSRFCIGK
ncbi:MAG: tRNA uridine-5-carboxymethylaminomethyl(34) synthesis GTPase MnmE [Gemmatimonadaceae bacterium]